MTTANPRPDVSVPVGVVQADAWESIDGKMPHRIIMGADRGVDGHPGTVVWTSAAQFADGTMPQSMRARTESTGMISSTIGVIEAETAPGFEPPTAVHEPAPDPGAPLAYSETIELPEPRGSRAPAALFIVAAAAVAAAVAGWFLVWPSVAPVTRHSVRPAPVTTSIQPPPAPQAPATDPPMTPVVLPPPPDPDTLYIDQLTQAGVRIENREGAIMLGHEVCSGLSRGYTYDALLSAAMTGSVAPLTRPQAAAFVGAAVVWYCPQYSNRIGG